MQPTHSYPWYTMFLRSGHLLALTIIIVLVAGLSAINTLPRLEDPRIDTRNGQILTLFPGASAERVEALVTDVIEDELRELYEIKDIDSTSRAGLSIIAFELQDWVDNTNNQQIFSKMRDRLADAATRFPATAGTPILDEKRNETSYTIKYAVSATYPDTMSLGMTGRFAAELADEIRNIAGTELVDIYGAPQEQITVSIDPDKLALVGLTGQAVSQAIRSADPKLPAGVVYTDALQLRVQVAQELASLDVIRNIPLVTGNGEYLRVADVAEVTRDWQLPMSQMALLDSEEVIFVAARMQTNLRVDQWTASVKDQVDYFVERYQGSINVVLTFDQNVYTDNRLSELQGNMILGFAVVIAVIFLFMGLKASWIVGLSLPLCASFAIFSLSFFGEEIHQMSIFGIIISIGLLIDNAIVMTDEIRKNLLDRSLSRLEALVKSTRHLFVPLLSSTITTVLGFMPIFLLNGNVGDFIGSIAISVVMALIGSFWISMTVIGALAARYLPRIDDGEAPWYSQGLKLPTVALALEHWLRAMILRPGIVLPVVVLLSFMGFGLSTTLPNVFFPSADRDQFAIEAILPAGTAIETTRNLALSMDTVIQSYEGVEQVTWLVGASTPKVYYNFVMNRDNSPEFANAIVQVDSAERARGMLDKLQQDLQSSFPQAKVVVKSFGQGPPIPAPVEIDVYGQDLAVLEEIGRDIQLIMSQIPGIVQTFATVTTSESELVINTTRDLTSQAGIQLTDLSAQLQLALNGQAGGSIVEQTEEIPIRVRISDEQRSDLVGLAALPLATQFYDPSNPWFPVALLGDFELRPVVSSITRKNGERINIISAFLEQGVAAVSVAQQVQDALADYPLPSGYYIKLGGDAGEQQRALGQLGTYLPVLLVMMFTALILTFKSVRFAGIIGAVAILSVGFGFLSLWLSGLPMGFNPLLGSVGLIGVAINDSIVVMAAIKANPRAMRGDIDAIVCETMGCTRHIFSTTITTVGGLLPLLLFSTGSFWPPLAVVIAGGVGFTVILGLVFTPTVVALLCRIRARKQIKQASDEAELA
ncbi:efflux RND transporter permease subunit [Alteromonas sp. LMIT006]|uniref:efflux RND transporter permease subunit n=1 Tax=Alteromonadaceae TaxID=72275 RepID=UPI0020CA4280|nr:efflux RND transporter permease subunit [Alteromonas sp. LMIT006]UTP72961.1 efflux RND transporter permease subunit [Alteromonas sp. LMIT006]